MYADTSVFPRIAPPIPCLVPSYFHLFITIGTPSPVYAHPGLPSLISSKKPPDKIGPYPSSDLSFLMSTDKKLY